jgi:hypothetical protein
MKSLTEFKKNEPSELVEEESSDYSKFDMLVRAGLANKAQIKRIHRILDKMKEERPVFNPTDRAILQNLFNKMVDLISNNKMIFQQTRRAVREEVEEEQINITEAAPMSGDPPFVLVLKRKSFRPFPNGMKVALYYNAKLDKYFSVPYSTEKQTDGAIQAEEYELIEESVMDQLHKIIDGKQSQKVKFGDGSSRTVDHYTASAITQVHKSLNDENKKKFAEMIHKSPSHFAKASDFAFRKSK